MIHAMSVKKANKGKKEKEESCSDQVDENMKNTDQMLRIKTLSYLNLYFFCHMPGYNVGFAAN